MSFLHTQYGKVIETRIKDYSAFVTLEMAYLMLQRSWNSPVKFKPKRKLTRHCFTQISDNSLHIFFVQGLPLITTCNSLILNFTLKVYKYQRSRGPVLYKMNNALYCTVKFTVVYLTIRLFARDFYEVIVDESEGKYISPQKSRSNNLIILF